MNSGNLSLNGIQTSLTFKKHTSNPVTTLPFLTTISTGLTAPALFRNQDYVLVAGDLNAKHASWSPIAQQNVAGHTIRRFCDSTGYSLNAPLEPTHFHKNLRNTVIDLAICKGMTITDVTSIPELSSDHNPVLFEVCLDNFTAPALSTYAFPNWKKFQEILTNSLPVPHQAYATLQRERHKDPSCRPHFTISTLATSPPLHQSPSASLPTMPPYSAIAPPPTKQFELLKHTSPNLKFGSLSGEFQLILKKTNAIIFRKRRSQTMPTQLKLFDESIDWTFETSYLGLTLNDNLTYRPHFNEIKKKYWSKHFSLIELLGKKSKLSLKNRIFIFKTYLRPILTYGCAIWGAAGNNHLEDLQRLQNKVLRIIARAPRFIPRSVLHEELRVEPIHTLIANLSSNFHSSIPYHNNPTINSQNYFRNLPPSTHRMPHSSANISPSF
ncbi:RNA-directed DNA polymerase from mobile element jockey [Trichonephila clavipes]|nr:RNA-directed DNA polymerase from mobile element jockey [Trichonephila clavipes]